MKKVFLFVIIAIAIFLPNFVCADTLIGTFDINYRYNAAGYAPSGSPNDGNPYYNISPPGPYFVDAAPGKYKVVTIGYGAAGPSNGFMWSGDAISGTRYYASPTGNIGDSFVFDHTHGQIVFYYWDWYAYDNPTDISVRVQLWRVETTTSFNISNVTVSNVSSTGATISWKTSVPSTSIVEFGTSSYNHTANSDGNVTNHVIVLGGLTASSLYHYRVKSTDASGNTRFSGDFTFVTSTIVSGGDGLWTYTITRRQDQSYLVNGSLTYASSPFNPYIWSSVTLTSIQLGAAIVSPYGYINGGILNPGETARFSVAIPASAGKPGSMSQLKFVGSYEEAPFGTFGLYGSFRVQLP